MFFFFILYIRPLLKIVGPVSNPVKQKKVKLKNSNPVSFSVLEGHLRSPENLAPQDPDFFEKYCIFV